MKIRHDRNAELVRKKMSAITFRPKSPTLSDELQLDRCYYTRLCQSNNDVTAENVGDRVAWRPPQIYNGLSKLNGKLFGSIEGEHWMF